LKIYEQNIFFFFAIPTHPALNRQTNRQNQQKSQKPIKKSLLKSENAVIIIYAEIFYATIQQKRGGYF